MNTFIFNQIYGLHKYIYIFAYLFIFNSVSNAATLKGNYGFESANLKNLACSGNCPSITTSPTASGKYSGNFILSKNMPIPYRTESVLKKNGHFDFGKEYWMGLSYKYKDWKKDSSPEMAPFQIHSRPANWYPYKGKTAKECGHGSAWGQAPFFMASANGETKFITYGGHVLWTKAIQTKKWMNIVVNFRLSDTSNGFIEVWQDGVNLGRKNGANVFLKDGCNNPMVSPYLKMGIYKWDWKKGRAKTNSTRRQLLIDNIKIAEGKNGFSDVSSNIKTISTLKNNFQSPPVKAVLKDTLPPKISKIQVSVTGTNAMISWNSNEASSSLVKYGLTSSYKSHTDNDLLVTSHKVTLKNLMAGKTYHYQVSSEDNSGNTGKGLNLTFTTDSPMEESLVAHWLMEDGKGTNVVDVSGNGHTGKLINGAKLIKGEGINFDGINDYLDVGKLNVSGKAITISAWFLADDLSNCRYQDCRILSKATSTREQDHYFMVSTVRAGSKTRLRFRLKTNGVTSTVVATSGDILENEWVHVSAIYDGETMRLYKDGIEVGSAAKRGNITINNKSSVWIGGNPSHGKSRPWKGQIDDVRIYSYSLTDDEIELLSLGQ